MRAKEQRRRKVYVNRLQVHHALGMDPGSYLRELKEATGLADWKLAHDLKMDSGCEVAVATVALWRKR